MVPENIHFSTKDGYLVSNSPPPHPPPPPSGISSLASYFPFKHLAVETPHPLRISDDPLWCRYGYTVHSGPAHKQGSKKVLSSHSGQVDSTSGQAIFPSHC